MCDYRERFAAAGKFPGGFLKREGRPNMKETLTSRLIDRPIRPLFPKGFMDEVQCQNFVLVERSPERRRHPGDERHGSGIDDFAHCPFLGPIASVRVGRIDGEFVPLPTHEELEESELDLIVSGTEEAVAMIEGFARELPEDVMADAITYAHGVIREIIALQRELVEKVGVEKIEFIPPEDDGLFDQLKRTILRRVEERQADGRQAGACRGGQCAARPRDCRDDSRSGSGGSDLLSRR